MEIKNSYTEKELSKLTNNELIEVINSFADRAEKMNQKLQEQCVICIDCEAKINELSSQINDNEKILNEYNLTVDKLDNTYLSIKNSNKTLEDIEQEYARALLVLNDRLNPS